MRIKASNMVQTITDGIMVSAEAYYQQETSNPLQRVYVFKCILVIDNFSASTVQLIYREWILFDSNGSYHTLKGNGLAGTRPVIDSGDMYEYTAEYTLSTDMGTARGTFWFEDKDSGSLHQVQIPIIDLIAPCKNS